MKITDEKFINSLRMILGAKKVLLVTHYRPDGDALSSICAMIEIMEMYHKDYFAFCADKPPTQFSFLPHIEKVNYEKKWQNFSEFDLIIALDCGEMSRTALVKEISNRTIKQIVIEFDHHPRVEVYSDIEVRFPDSSSTAEILYRFVDCNNIKISKNLANCILTGILTDTDRLLNNATTDEAVKIASKMMLFGASYQSILEDTWKNKSLAGMKAWGRAMREIKINKKYNFAISVLTRKDIEESGASEEELEGMANFLTRLEGVKGLMMIREISENKVKGSFRSLYPGIDVSVLARQLGGGGHPKASAFVVDGHVEKIDTGWKIVD